jgi:hypothetical protein
MLIKNFKYLMVVVLIIFTHVSLAVTYHDPLSYSRAFEILKTAKSQFEEMKRVRDELASTKRLIGNFQQEAENIKSELTNWRNYYDKIDNLDLDNFSAMNWLNLDNRLAINNSVQAFNEIKLKLFEHKSEQIEFARQHLVRNSIIAGVVTAEANKKSLSDAKNKIIITTNASLADHDLLSAIKNQNKLLGVIASEMVQSRAIQAQQLELLAAFFAQFEGTGRLTEPNKLPTKKNVWE